MKKHLVQWRYILMGCCLAANPLLHAQDQPDPPDARPRPEQDTKRDESHDKDTDNRGPGDQAKRDDDDRSRADGVRRGDDDDDKAKAQRDRDDAKRKADEEAAKERADKDGDVPAR